MHSPSYRRRGNQKTLGRPWTYIEIGLLKELAQTQSPKQIAKKLNRSYESVRKMAFRCDIRFRIKRSYQDTLKISLCIHP